MLQEQLDPERDALEARVRLLREELARAERQLRLARGEDPDPPGQDGAALLAWHESVERALEEALGRLRSHVESSPLAVVEWSADRKVVGWSAEAERLFGWTLDEVRGHRIDELGLVAAEDLPALDRFLAEAGAGPGPRKVVPRRNIRKDGGALWCEWYSSVLRDRGGRVASVLSLVLDVTQRCRAEEALQASQAAVARRAAELETIFETLEFPLLVFDADGNPVRSNHAARLVLGLDPAQLTGEQYADHVLGRLRMRLRGGAPLARAELPAGRAVRGERVRRMLVDVTDGEGRTRALTITALPLLVDGSVSGAVVAWYDVTERLAAEELYRGVARSVPGGALCVVDRELRFLVAEGGLLPQLGFPREALEGRRVDEVVPGEPGRRAAELFGRALSGETATRESRWGERLLLTHYGPLRAAEGVHAALALTLDITDRMQAEEAMRASEERFRTLADNAPEVIVRFDRDLRHLYANPAIEAATGIPPERIAGCRLEDSGLPPEVAATWARVLRRVFDTGAPERFDFQFDPPPGPAHYEALVVPERDAAGGIHSVLGLVRNVTDRKRLEVAREEEAERQASLRRAAESAVRAKDEFLAMLGHELRNPLAPILTAVELLRLRAGDAYAREQATIERHARHLMRLVDDLLDVSRITRGMVKLVRQPVGVREVIDRALEMAGPLLQERAHAMEVAVPGDLTVDADEERLAQVFANLLTNAAKYTPDGGRIRVRARAEADRVRVTVTDDGMGIAPELLPRIFDLFVQGDRRLDRAQGGLGLGLTLVHALTEAHGGRVKARSAGPGRGSEFEVELPLDRARARGRPAPPQVRPSGEGAVRVRRVLVVDDNRDAAEMLAEGLRMAGHEVRVAYDGPEALRVAGELDPEVALVDIGLPVMNGYELAQRLRTRDGTPCHLVAVTGYGQESDRARAREHGFDAHVVKPVDLDGIRDLVQHAPRSHQ